MMKRSWRRQISPMRRSSSGVQTRPAGVVGVAQQHELHRRVGRTALEVLEVDAVAVAVEHQVALLGRAAAVGNGDVEVVVDRRLDQHLVSRTGHGPQDGRKGGNDARHRVDPLPLGRPSVAAQKPAPDRLGIGLGRYGVAVDAVLDPPAQRLDDRRGRAEIHVGNPHGQHAVGYPVVPFHGAGAPPGTISSKSKCSISVCMRFEVVSRSGRTNINNLPQTAKPAGGSLCTPDKFGIPRRMSYLCPVKRQKKRNHGRRLSGT